MLGLNQTVHVHWVGRTRNNIVIILIQDFCVGDGWETTIQFAVA